MDMFSKNMKDVARTVDEAVASTDRLVTPYRQSVMRRFPTLFALLVAFGAATTFYGIERIIGDVPWLAERPWLILTLGVLTLALTGRLYKKLNE